MTGTTAMRGIRALGCFLLLFALLAGLSAVPVRAEISFSVTPGLLDLRATPGAVGSQDLVISNTGSDRLALAVAVEPVPSAPLERSAVAWLAPAVAALALEPGAQETIAIGIVVPDRVETGGYYARVTLTTISNEAGANQAAIAGQLGVGMLLTVEGDGELVRNARIAQFAPVLESDGRVGFRMQVINEGNVHLIAPAGTVTVTHPDGSSFGSLDFPEGTPLLPGAETTLTTRGSLPLAPRAGYHAEAAFTYLDGSDDGAAITTSVEFTVEAELALEPSTVCENLDRGPTLTVTFRNAGQLGLQPLVTLALIADAGGPLGASPLGGAQILWPGETRSISVDFPERLVSGTYRLVTSVEFDPRGVPAVQETPFQIGGLTGTPAPLCSDLAA